MFRVTRAKGARQTEDIAVLKAIKMSVPDWIKVEDNPIQRDTERHAAKAKHLLTPLPTHGIVFAAELPSGKLIKLDGHTRAYLWNEGKALPPAQLITVNVIPVENRGEAEKLYKTFDSAQALETARDKISGAFNRFNFNAQSPLLKAGSIGTALKMAYNVLVGRTPNGFSHETPDQYELIKEFQNELVALDAFGSAITPATCPGGFVAAFIISWRRHGRVVLPFWTDYFAGNGIKANGRMDAIQAVRELMLARKRGRAGGNAMADMCERILRGVEGWIVDEKFKRIPTPLDTTGYLTKHRRANERLLKKADVERELAAAATD
jgi:hypothetical protein